MNNTYKQRIFEEARALFLSDYGEDKLQGGCVYWALVAHHVLTKHGFNPLIQAGDLSWPIVTRQQDDGVCASHFSFIWDPSSVNSMLAMASGGIPEIHVWIGLIGGGPGKPITGGQERDGEIVDFSTGCIRQVAASLGYPWCTPNPPDFVWGKPPDNVFYQPQLGAMRYVFDLIRRNAIPCAGKTLPVLQE